MRRQLLKLMVRCSVPVSVLATLGLLSGCSKQVRPVSIDNPVKAGAAIPEGGSVAIGEPEPPGGFEPMSGDIVPDVPLAGVILEYPTPPDTK